MARGHRHGVHDVHVHVAIVDRRSTGVVERGLDHRQTVERGLDHRQTAGSTDRTREGCVGELVGAIHLDAAVTA